MTTNNLQKIDKEKRSKKPDSSPSRLTYQIFDLVMISE